MFKNFYGFLSGQKLRQINLFSYLNTAEDYDKIHSNGNNVFDKDGNLIIDCNSDPVFISVGDAGETYVGFYQNLFFLFLFDREINDRIVQIYVKRPDDEWKVPVNEDGSFDFINPTTVKVEVYVNYDVSVIKLDRKLSRCYGEDYHYGVWNKMFYKSLNSFMKTVEDYTEINQIKHAYER